MMAAPPQLSSYFLAAAPMHQYAPAPNYFEQQQGYALPQGAYANYLPVQMYYPGTTPMYAPMPMQTYYPSMYAMQQPVPDQRTFFGQRHHVSSTPLFPFIDVF